MAKRTFAFHHLTKTPKNTQCVAHCRGSESSCKWHLYLSVIRFDTLTALVSLLPFVTGKTLSIDKNNFSFFPQVNFHQIRLEYFISTGSMCVYVFYSLEVYVDILSGRKSLVTAHTWIVIYALFGYHIVFCIQHVLRFVNSTGVLGVVMNYIFFLLSCIAAKYIYIIYFSWGLLKFIIYVTDAVFSHFGFV
jgi:hypothetical protein